MFVEILRFELAYRFRRPATYIYFAIFFLLAFFTISTDVVQIGGSAGQIKENAPVVLANMMVILSVLPGLFIASGLMGVPVMRDFDHQTEAMFFTAPLRQGDYLGGRFAGSFLTAVFVFAGIPLGFMVGTQMPWLDPQNLLPFQLWHYVQPFLILVLPNLFIAGAVFFMGGSLSRRLLYVFVQGVIFFAIYMIGNSLLEEMEQRTLVALADPMGINLINVITNYWTVSEQNSQVLPLAGLLLSNRLIWVGVGALCYLLTLRLFRRNGKSGKPRAAAEVRASLPAGAIVVPQVATDHSFRAQLSKVLTLSRIYYREIVRSIPFLSIVAVGMLIVITNSFYVGQMYGVQVKPTTYYILDLLEGFDLFFIILAVFYTGELVWRERDLRMNQIFDALPVPTYAGLVAALLALFRVQILLLILLMGLGMAIQTAYGYYEYNLPVYLSGLFGDMLSFALLFTLLSFFVHVLANQKFLGHALIILFFIVTAFAFNELGLEHSLFRFASGSLGSYSDMNGFGHYVAPFAWLKTYWGGFAALLFMASVLLSVRGVDSWLSTRLRLARQRFTRPALVLVLSMLLLFTASGFVIYYNTNILNDFRSSKAQEKLQAEYEKTLKRYQDLPQPRIVETRMEVDLYPSRRDFDAKGYYILKNKTASPISRVYIQNHSASETHTDSITFEGGATLAEAYERFRFQVYELAQPLAPGDSLRMDFRVAFRTPGFVTQGDNSSVVENGLFINNSYFPSLGYDRDFELGDDKERRKRGLPERERMRERSDSLGQRINLVGDDADNIRFGIRLSTEAGQIAVAPGYLRREWQENGRHYFQYEMDQPMFNFYSMLSARYEVMRDIWQAPDGRAVSLEIYYHPGHTYNLDRMMRGMKEALGYFSKAFSPYQHRQMRILEFPRYEEFAQSFANTVPFSEGIGFVLDIQPGDVDMAFYVTAHEMAHQWWGHQVSEAQVKGNAMLSETLSQYSALMVMKQTYGPEQMKKFLEYELDSYLQGRSGETKKEQPLVRVEGQGYIHYRKGSLVMYALQDYIGEDKVNAALHSFLRDWAWREDRYPTSADLMGYFRQATPDSLAYLLEDMFETITLYENRALAVSASPLGEGRHRVSLDLSAVKYRADSLGNETAIPFSDWMDVGVYGADREGKDSLIYLRKHRIAPGQQRVEVEVSGKPLKAGIDPINKLIDRDPKDNVKQVEAL
jgi:hypothetical protein